MMLSREDINGINPRPKQQPLLTLAVQPDRLQKPDGQVESYSDRWIELARRWGLRVREVDVRRHDIFQQLSGCDALLWRNNHLPRERQIARRLLPIVEKHLKLHVFPNQATCWHYDDKIAQAYLFDALKIPAPRTWIFWTLDAAERFCREAAYPLVLKLSQGASSQNVCLVRGPGEAMRCVDRLFRGGTTTLERPPLVRRTRRALRASARKIALRKSPVDLNEVHKGYVLFQEFLPNNAYDTRVTIIGSRAFAFRRFNRPNDFRASGSGRIDYAQDQIDLEFVKLAWEIARRLGMQSCAIDGLYRQGQPAVAEISYTFSSQAIYNCPGHWKLATNGCWTPPLWQLGQVWPQDALLEDFIENVRAARQVR